uniref:Uncharacterized protein n=1 Tax=Anguilla anguilla TaxID=7936 RepID=A0A0E9QJ85_ANGAN
MNIFNWVHNPTSDISIHFSTLGMQITFTAEQKSSFPFFLLLAKVWNLAVPRPMGEAILDKETSRCQLKKSLFIVLPIGTLRDVQTSVCRNQMFPLKI